MSTLAVNDRRNTTRKPRAHAGHLWPVPSDTPPTASATATANASSVASPAGPVTVSITVDGADPASRDRVLAALRELVAVAGATAEVEVREPAGPAAPPVVAAAPGRVEPSAPPVISLDPRPRTVIRDGWPLHLSRLEYDLLLFLAQHPRQVFSRSQLLARVWGHTHTTLRTVDVHVSRLRGKLDGQELITTVYGLGYRLADDAVVRVAA